MTPKEIVLQEIQNKNPKDRTLFENEMFIINYFLNNWDQLKKTISDNTISFLDLKGKLLGTYYFKNLYLIDVKKDLEIKINLDNGIPDNKKLLNLCNNFLLKNREEKKNLEISSCINRLI